MLGEEIAVLAACLGGVGPGLVAGEIPLGAQVPFAPVARGVALPVQDRLGVGERVLRERLLLAAPGVDVGQNAVRVGVEAGEDRSPRGGAVGGDAGGIVEPGSFAPDAVHVGRVDVRVAGRGERAVMLLVGHQEEDVGAALLFGPGGARDGLRARGGCRQSAGRPEELATVDALGHVWRFRLVIGSLGCSS